MFKGRNWLSGGLTKPKNPHSLEHLKYLYGYLSKNQQVSDNNRSLLVESLRSIAEILIWGDQNDSSVFDFFLEKNMLSFFLKIMRQKCGRYVCVQLLQTLNILFENIRNETSLYYLLSNNHVNSIIVHKFDFSDEEVMAYYISFLKTLSLKLNIHTIHFFYNEHTNDFPLYTEAIKFFNQSESMVRIAVRTLTLNVYRVNDKSMMKFIRDKTAAPYFSNLVWFIANHIMELDACATSDPNCPGHSRLSDLVAEHLDHLHYLNDMLKLEIETINEVLTEHLLQRLFIPLYVYSLPLTKEQREKQNEDGVPNVCSVVSLFLLSQVFLIITHWPLVQHLSHIILGKISSESENSSDCKFKNEDQLSKMCFISPPEPLEKSLQSHNKVSEKEESKCSKISDESNAEVCPVNITDEEKVETAQSLLDQNEHQDFDLAERPYLKFIFDSLDCTENDHQALFASCLLYAMGHNNGINQHLLDSVFIPTARSETKHWYNIFLVEKLITIINLSCQHNSRVRLATLEISLVLLKQLVYKNGKSFLQDKHLADIEEAREASTLMLRNYYKSEEIFLDMFEDEYKEMKRKPLNVEYLTMDSSILLAPTGTPMSGVEFNKRLPCGEVERARWAIRVFFLLRDLSLTLRLEPEQQLPLTNPQAYIQVGDVLDLNNSDLIACTVVSKDGGRIRRFLVIDVIQLILVEPDFKKLGWGIAKCVGFLQDLEVSGDKDDSRCLHITIHKPCSSNPSIAGSSFSSKYRSVPLLTAKFVFDDHIRCMAAKQRLSKGRLKARQRKMYQIAKLLDLPGNIQPCPSPPAHVILPLRHTDMHSKLQRVCGHSEHGASRSKSSSSLSGQHRPIFNTGAMPKVPGVATMLKKESLPELPSSAGKNPRSNSSITSANGPQGSTSDDASEEIPLEDMLKANGPNSTSNKKYKESGEVKKSEIFAKMKKVKSGKHIKKQTCVESDHSQPKTLRKAEAPPASLLSPTGESEANSSVPKLVPPVDSGSINKNHSVKEKAATTSVSEKETSFTEGSHATASSASHEFKPYVHVSPISSPNDITMMSISVDSQSFDPSSDAAMATASITSSTISSEILDDTLDEAVMSESFEKYKSKNNGIRTI